MAYVFTTRDIAIAVLGFIFPPFGVLLRAGCGADLCINILLTLLGHLPGVAHCWYIILRHARQRAIRQGYSSITDLEQGNETSPTQAQRVLASSQAATVATTTTAPDTAPDTSTKPAQNAKPKAKSSVAGPSTNEASTSNDPPPAYTPTAEGPKEAAHSKESKPSA
ncbi:hypothetical protein BDF19DRAFT_448874 [Syncephalis fuscata]|nr:hypothetical protein BDF19DRAFT_448874 [Syncephalis fuscata]